MPRPATRPTMTSTSPAMSCHCDASVAPNDFFRGWERATGLRAGAFRVLAGFRDLLAVLLALPAGFRLVVVATTATTVTPATALQVPEVLGCADHHHGGQRARKRFSLGGARPR